MKVRRIRVYGWAVCAYVAFSPIAATINHERMPGLLTREAELGIWTEGTTDEDFALARRLEPESMLIVQAGFEKQDLLAAG